MGLIYSSADSSELMSALSSNLSVARTTTSELTAGCQQLIAAIDGHTLSGVAYNAGKGLFSELVIPTIHRMTAAIDHVQSDLTKYGAANAFISSEGYLNEDKLKLQIKIMKASQKSLHEAAKQVATIAYNTPIPGIHDLLKDTQRTLIQMADSLQQDIDKIQKKLQKLNDFAMQINGLFNNSLNEMELAMQGVTVLNETTVKSNGTYTLPSGVDKSYFTEIKKDTKNEVTDKQLLEGCTIIRVRDKSRGFEYYMLEKDGYSYHLDEQKLTGNLASLVKKYDLDVVELTPKELTTRVNNQQKKGYNYFDKNEKIRGLGLLSHGQDFIEGIQESGVWNSLWSVGMGVASVRNAQTFSGKVQGNKPLTGTKNGKNYGLDKSKSTGNATYKKISENGNKWKNPDGTIKWPPNNGAVPGTEEMVTLKKGDTFGRIGKDTGRYTAPTGSSSDKLALAPGTDLSVYTEYEIIKDIPNVERAQIAPWFDKPGGGTQMLMPHSIKTLIEKGYIIPK